MTNPERFASLGAEAIMGAVRWYDAQAGRVGLGVLVAELRAGGKPGWHPARSVLDREAAYLEAIVAWLRRHFPDLDRPAGPHPAAVAEVIRLHHRHGRGSLTRREHGPAVRAAVARWECKWTEQPTEGKAA